MKKIRLISAALALLTAASLMTAPMGLSVFAVPADISAVTEQVPDDNVLYESDFDSIYCMDGVSATEKWLSRIETKTGAYLQLKDITTNYVGITITNPHATIPAGDYKFTGFFRMMYEDEVTALRLNIYDTAGSMAMSTINIYPTSDEWMKVEFYLTLTAPFNYISVCGGADPKFIQPYCIDNFSLVPVSSIPSGYTLDTSWGTVVSGTQAEKSQVDSLFSYPKWDAEFESRYEVQGVIVNQDADALISGLAGTGGSEADFIKFAQGYADSHVTDFMMCVCNMVSTAPTDLPTWTDLVDKYYTTEENGYYDADGLYKTNSYALGAYKHFVENGIDYFEIWCETFPTVGINPWISIRMNDIHGANGTITYSISLSDYFYKNPNYRRVQHTYTASTYSGYSRALNYYHDDVRQRMLDYINDMLSRYDCYGLELDFQRDMWLWHFGGEYNGLEILNGFMREVDRIIAIYESKYGHEIKLGIRCASDIETNYDFGLDILTWAAEGILDQVIPTGRYQTADSNIPVKEWTSLLHPYGVIVAPCIEQYIDSANRVKNTLATYNGMAASFLSQGADKIALYNEYLGLAQYIDEKHKIFTEDESVGGTWRHWNIVSTIGSLEKLMTLDRRVIVTYNDTFQVWRRQSNAQLPQTVVAGKTITLHIPVGDVAVGSTVTFKFSVNAPNDAVVPTVYINSKRAVFAGTEECQGGFTSNKLLCYTVPVSAYDDMYIVAEIIPENELTVDHAEVHVKAAD